MNEKFSQLDKCVEELNRLNAAFFIRETDTGKEIVHYSPYVHFNPKDNVAKVWFYVYHWCDSYDSQGNFISHKVYDDMYVSEVDRTI